jgi:hypothetical protein
MGACAQAVNKTQIIGKKGLKVMDWQQAGGFHEYNAAL